MANWKHEPRSHALGPIQTIVPVGEKFHVSLGYVCLGVSAPKMLENFRAIGFLKMSDAETPSTPRKPLLACPETSSVNLGNKYPLSVSIASLIVRHSHRHCRAGGEPGLAGLIRAVDCNGVNAPVAGPHAFGEEVHVVSI